MMRVLAVCFPATDLSFGERVRHVVDRGRWDLGSPEGIALMESVLRRSYPMATILPSDVRMQGGWRSTLVLEVHRDGPTDPVSTALRV